MSNRHNPDLSDVSAYIGTYLAVAACVIGIDWLTLPAGASLAREGGGIELISMLGYVVAMASYLWTAWVPLWSVPAVLLFMAARELDLDKVFTSEGILSTKVILHDTSLWEKLLALGVWALLVATLVSLARHRGLPLLRDLRRGEPWALAFTAGFVVAGASKSIDGLARKLAPLGIEITEATSQGLVTVEETMEMLIPVFFILAALLRARAHAFRFFAQRPQAAESSHA